MKDTYARETDYRIIISKQQVVGSNPGRVICLVFFADTVLHTYVGVREKKLCRPMYEFHQLIFVAVICIYVLFTVRLDVEKRLPKAKLISLCQSDPVQEYVKHYDHILYQGLVEVLIPDVLRPIPSEFLSQTYI